LKAAESGEKRRHQSSRKIKTRTSADIELGTVKVTAAALKCLIKWKRPLSGLPFSINKG
jgi:hypothetical protein